MDDQRCLQYCWIHHCLSQWWKCITDVSEVILCYAYQIWKKESKALHKALEIIEGMLYYKVVCIMELLYKRNGTQKTYFLLLRRPNNNYLGNYNLHTRRSQRDITLYKALHVYSADVRILYHFMTPSQHTKWYEF